MEGTTGTTILSPAAATIPTTEVAVQALHAVGTGHLDGARATLAHLDPAGLRTVQRSLDTIRALVIARLADYGTAVSLDAVAVEEICRDTVGPSIAGVSEQLDGLSVLIGGHPDYAVAAAAALREAGYQTSDPDEQQRLLVTGWDPQRLADRVAALDVAARELRADQAATVALALEQFLMLVALDAPAAAAIEEAHRWVAGTLRRITGPLVAPRASALVRVPSGQLVQLVALLQQIRRVEREAAILTRLADRSVTYLAGQLAAGADPADAFESALQLARRAATAAYEAAAAVDSTAADTGERA